MLSCRCSILTAKSRSSPAHRGASAAPSSSGWPSTAPRSSSPRARPSPARKWPTRSTPNTARGAPSPSPRTSRRRSSCAHLAEETTRVFGQIDVLVCNAASNPHYGPLHTITDEQFTKIAEQQHRLQPLADQPGGAADDRPQGRLDHHRLVGRRLARQPDPRRLLRFQGGGLAARAQSRRSSSDRTTCGSIASRPASFAPTSPSALWENPENLKRATSRTPLGRIGEPDEIAGAAILLASKAGTFMTGQAIVIDGGNTIT